MTNPPILSPSALQAYEHLSLPVWVFSVDSLRILASNKAAQDWLGYDAQTLHAMTITELRPEEEREPITDKVRRFHGITTDAGQWTIVAKCGARYTVSFSWHKVLLDGSEVIVSSIRDMTQVAKAQAKAAHLSGELEALRARIRLSQEHISDLFDGIPGKMVVLTADDQLIAAVTDEYAQAIMRDREALLGTCIYDILPVDPADPDATGLSNLKASIERVKAMRVTDVMRLQRHPLRNADGALDERYWLSRNKPVFDSDGNLIYIIHRIDDVTRILAGDTGPGTENDRTQHAAEAHAALLALQERDKRLLAAEMLLDLGALEFDITRKEHCWSDRVFEMYGVPREQGAPTLDDYVALVHPDDRAQMLDTYTRFLETGASEITFQHRILRKDGTVAHLRGVGVRHSVEGRDLIIGFAQDVTGYKLAEERLREATRLQKAAGILARLGSWRVAQGQTDVNWSAQTAEIHDEPADKVPQLEDFLNYCIPQHRSHITAVFEACAGKGKSFDVVYQITTARGRIAWVRSIGEAVRDADGQIVAVEGALQDISELIASRDAADELARRLRDTLESISDAFMLLDYDWQVTFVNKQAEALLQRGRHTLLSRNIWTELAEIVDGSFEQTCRQAVEEGKSVRVTEYFPLLKGWLEFDAEPTPEGLAVYFRDVTRARARDQELRLLKAAVDRQNDILLITEADRVSAPDGPRIVYVNDAFERQTGFTRDEVIGQTPRILQGPATQRDELDRISHALKTLQPVRAELINYTKAGTEIWLDMDIVPVADENGVFTHWVAIERDITQRKQAEIALQTNEERFRLVTKASGNAVWEWDIVNDRDWWSEGLKEIFGHEPEPPSARPSLWISHIHPDDKPRVDAALERLRAGDDQVLQQQYRFQRADGSWARVEDRAFAVRDKDGTVTRILGSMTDISERLQLEDRLRQAQKMEAVGQLTGGVAHDFNNLLTIILGNAEILDVDLEDQPALQKLSQMIINAADRGAELTNRLLAFSRKQALSPQVLDIGKLIDGMDPLLRRTLPENIEIEVIRAGGLWKTELDVGQLESALLNLALNARDAMPEGGQLTIEIMNASLDDDYVALEPDVKSGQYVMIGVTDTGHGIPPDLITRVFEPFFTTKSAGKGSGLGLSMIYGFVKQSGGHIRVYSEPNEGTSFKLYFPRCRATEHKVVTTPAGRKFTGGTETILVVEDEEQVRQHVLSQLESLGYNVIGAASGPEALDLMKSHGAIDLLFTDVVMPGGLGGRDLADAARAIHPSLKVLFTSGYTENSIVHNGRLDLGVDLLSKPYRREQLALKVRKVLDRET